MATAMLIPTEDAFTDSYEVTTNHGTDIWMWMDPDAYIYLKFVLPANSGMTAAYLEVYQSSTPGNPPRLYLTSNSWTEMGLNWSNQPATGTQIGTLSVSGTSGVVQSTALTGLGEFPTSGEMSITIRPAATGADLGEYLSREDDDGFEPKLYITYNEPGGSTPYRSYTMIVG